VPQKRGRETFFKSLSSYHHPVVCFESTHRIIKTLTTLVEQYPDATVRLGRELTKQFEEMIIGTPSELLAQLTNQPERQKGEFVVLFEHA
jgi:Predicted methyltransferases